MKLSKKLFTLGTLLFSAILFVTSCKTTKPAVVTETTPAVIAKNEESSKATENVQTQVVEPTVKIAENATSVSGIITEFNSKYGNLSTSLTENDLNSVGIEIGDIVAVDICGKIMAVPVVTNFSDVDVGCFLVHVSNGSVGLAINHGNATTTLGAKEGIPISVILSEKEGYLKDFIIRRLERTENRADYASDEIFANARVVATTGIKPNTIYRSCNPSLSDARAPFADAFAKKVGIKTAINLANNKVEYDEEQAKLVAEYYSSLVNSGNVVFLNMGANVMDKDFAEKLATGLKFMISHDGPYLVHCNEGKDRAGFVNAVLEALAGASLEEIKADYMKSFENYFYVEVGSEKYNHISKNIVMMLENVNGGKPVDNSNVQQVAEDYVLKNVGLTSSELKQLKKKIKA